MLWKEIIYGSQGNGFRWKSVSADIPFMDVLTGGPFLRRLDSPTNEDGRSFSHVAIREIKGCSYSEGKAAFAHRQSMAVSQSVSPAW